MTADQENIIGLCFFFSCFFFLVLLKNVSQLCPDVPINKINSSYLYCKVYQSVDVQCWFHEIKDKLYMVSQGKMIRCS